MSTSKHKRSQRLHRHARVRGAIFGTAQRPRLNVFRSHEHIYAQVIDDSSGVTLAAASSKEVAKKDKKQNVALEVGKLVAGKALAKHVTEVIFDRGGYLYHGRVKALAEGAREGGLKF